jgi:hypothetical protein
MILVPIDPENEHERYDVQLEGTTYTLDLDWNERAGLWFLTLSIASTAGSTVLMRSCACVVGHPLTLGLATDDWTGGQLVVEGDRDPEREDWGTHAYLYYATRAEVEGTIEANT